MERTPIGTFHFRNSWTAVGSFCADFHESHRRSPQAGSQAAFVVMGKIRCLPMCHWAGNTVAFDSNSHFLKVGIELRCSGLLSGSRCLSPLAIHRTRILGFDAFSRTIVRCLNLPGGDSVNIPLCDNLGAMEWLKLSFPISIHRCHTKKALMQWSMNW